MTGFAFTDEQRELAAAVRDLLDDACPPERVREAWDRPDGRVPGLWARLADMGVLGLLVPEAHGGLGLDDVDAVQVWFELGRAGVPDPVLETAAVAPRLLVAAGRDHELAALAAGELVVSAATFSMPHLPHADVADLVIVFGQLRRAVEAHGALAFDPARLRLERIPSVDGARRLFTASTAMADRGEDLGVERGDVERAHAAGLVAHGAFLLGLGQRMLELTVDYVRERHQFGVPIGSFQAIKHHCADALLALELAKPVVWRAAWSLANADDAGAGIGDDDVAVHAAMAKAHASEAATEVGRQALQCHAAIGYTTEYDLHLYLKRTWALARAWGDAATHRARVARSLLDG